MTYEYNEKYHTMTGTIGKEELSITDTIKAESPTFLKREIRGGGVYLNLSYEVSPNSMRKALIKVSAHIPSGHKPEIIDIQRQYCPNDYERQLSPTEVIKKLFEREDDFGLEAAGISKNSLQILSKDKIVKPLVMGQLKAQVTQGLDQIDRYSPSITSLEDIATLTENITNYRKHGGTLTHAQTRQAEKVAENLQTMTNKFFVAALQPLAAGKHTGRAGKASPSEKNDSGIV